jgi:hypothetical protein
MKASIKAWFLYHGLEASLSRPFLRRVYPYRYDERTLAEIDPALLATEAWRRTGKEIGKGELKDIFGTIPGAHKWLHYFPIYQAVFGPFRSRPINLLEIGVYKGGSLQLWRKYFHPQANIVGVDIDRTCERFDDPANRIHVRIGSQDDAKFLSKIVSEFGPFDVIIDDGSHKTTHIIASFNALFDRGLKNGGAYLVEDLHSNYWLSHRTGSVSFIDVGKTLIDLLHNHYVDAPGEGFFRKTAAEFRTEYFVPRITRLIDEIRVFDSVFVIQKSAGKEPPVSELR